MTDCYEHYTYDSYGYLPGSTTLARHAAYRLHYSNHLKKSECGHSAIFKIATENFPVLLALPDSMHLWRYLIGNIWWNIPIVRYDYL
jgi:hypothetical protein